MYGSIAMATTATPHHQQLQPLLLTGPQAPLQFSIFV